MGSLLSMKDVRSVKDRGTSNVYFHNLEAALGGVAMQERCGFGSEQSS